MTCTVYRPVYAPQTPAGLSIVASKDPLSLALEWAKAYASANGNSVAYNIFYSTDREDVFTEGVKYVSISGDLTTTIADFTPGITIHCAVRAVEYEPAWFNLNQLPDSTNSGLKLIPESLLLSDIGKTDTSIPISDIDDWPSYGVAQIGVELVRYISKDIPNSSLVVSERGFLETSVRIHNTDGYDGYRTHSPIIKFWNGFDDENTRIQMETFSFGVNSWSFTSADGYATNTDKLTEDLSANDADMADFPEYDHVGWHRTDPRSIVDGKCIGTYIGGEQWCADGYLGVGRKTRGIPLNEQAARREEMLLNTTGWKVVLAKRMWEGVRCKCVKAHNEQPEYRCPNCYGVGFVNGYYQFFNERRSDGRILVRPSPYQDTLKYSEGGLESEAIIEFWTLTYPTIKSRDFIITFDLNGTEQFRYEVLDVTRNALFGQDMGVQKFRAQRVRKTDPIVQWRYISDTSTIPTTLTTGIGFMPNENGILTPHTHTIVINEGITSVSQINQNTSVSMGHSHRVVNGVVQNDELGHTHSIILP